MIESLVDGVCVLQLDAPPLNTLSFSLVDDLLAAIRRAIANPEVQGIVLTGTPQHFSAGADLAIFRLIQTDEDAARACRVFQQAFQEIEDSAKPIVVALAGRVMGGALELAMACDYRIATRTTRFSMPEVTLGINPGAGGTQRLPRLVGVPSALKMLLSGEPIGAEEACRIGLLDAVCEPAELIATARSLLASKQWLRRDRVAFEDPAAKAALDEAQTRARKGRPEILGAAAILEAVRIGLDDSFEAGLRAEQEQFARCLKSPAAQNKIYLFFASRQTAKVPELAGVTPQQTARAAVVGMGTMGTGIAQALVQIGIPTVCCDQDRDAVARAVQRIGDSLRKRVAVGKLAPERAENAMSLLVTSAGYSALADADFVIEAVFEDPDVKRAVFRGIEQVCPKDAIIASNTSSIRLDDLAEDMLRPERLIGVHFFNPAHRMPLVEIIPRTATPKTVTAAALELAKRLGKTAVVVKDCEGFLVDRLFVPYLKEAFWLLEEGAEPSAIDRAMFEFGFPMGPLALIDMAGLDILVGSDRAIAHAYPRHGPLSAVVSRLVAGGQVGQKAGAGVYRYVANDRTPHPNETAGQIIAEVQKERQRDPRSIGQDEITDRLVMRLVNEAFYAMEEQVARSAADLDVATVLGIGFPDFRGGVLRHARQLGHDRVLEQLQTLSARFGERFSPCE